MKKKGGDTIQNEIDGRWRWTIDDAFYNWDTRIFNTNLLHKYILQINLSHIYYIYIYINKII